MQKKENSDIAIGASACPTIAIAMSSFASYLAQIQMCMHNSAS